MSSNKSILTTTEDVQKYVTMLFGIRRDIDKLQLEYDKLFEHLQLMVRYLPRSYNNNLPLCSNLFNSWLYSTPFKRPEEKVSDDDEVEEIHIASKTQRIEKERFPPPPLPSSSSSSSSIINKPRVLTSIHKDVDKEGKRRLKRL
jgi:hypothetical protein